MRILIFLLINVISFILGICVHKYQIFPYQILSSVYHFVTRDNNQAEVEAKALAEAKAKALAEAKALVNLNSSEIQDRLTKFDSRASDARNFIRERTILDADTVIIREEYLGDDEYQITAQFYGIKINGIVSKTHNANCLTVYIQGHGGNPFDFDYHNRLRDKMLVEDCDFLSFSMLGLGLNSGGGVRDEVFFPSMIAGSSKLILDSNRASKHGNYSFFYDRNSPDKDPLSLFLSGHYYIIEKLSKNYQYISLIGISGGGWYTTWLAALIPDIDVSVSYAGTLPLAYRSHFNNDWEEVYSNIYKYIDYWDLYLLGTMDQKFEPNRKVFLIYNDKDPCCFMDPFASDLKIKLDKLNLTGLSILVEDNESHSIDPGVAFPILKPDE